MDRSHWDTGNWGCGKSKLEILCESSKNKVLICRNNEMSNFAAATKVVDLCDVSLGAVCIELQNANPNAP